jgi:hypothetical protein
MKMVKLLVLGMVVAGTLPLVGFLPPDFKYRQKEYVQRRVNERVAYEEREKEYDKSLIAQRIRVEAAMSKPLWEPTSVDKRIFDKKENRLVQPAVVGAKAVPAEKVSASAQEPARVVTNAAIQKPPRRNVEGSAISRVNDEVPLPVQGKEPKLNNRFLISIVLLILIGLSVGWVWYKTRKIDE